jgi:hypothetical protein
MNTENKKQLGQIAYEGIHGAHSGYNSIGQITRDMWESGAQAVKEAVLAGLPEWGLVSEGRLLPTDETFDIIRHSWSPVEQMDVAKYWPIRRRIRPCAPIVQQASSESPSLEGGSLQVLTKWVMCPICGGTDMQWTADGDEGEGIINCTNLACRSNGKGGYDELLTSLQEKLAEAEREWKQVWQPTAEVRGAELLRQYERVESLEQQLKQAQEAMPRWIPITKATDEHRKMDCLWFMSNDGGRAWFDHGSFAKEGSCYTYFMIPLPLPSPAPLPEESAPQVKVEYKLWDNPPDMFERNVKDFLSEGWELHGATYVIEGRMYQAFTRASVNSPS